PFGSEQWLPLNSSPIRFNVPLFISGYVDAGIPTSHGVQSMGPRPYNGYAHVSLEIVGIRAYDSDMRLTGEWTQMIQAPTATYVTTLATPEPSTLSMLTIAALGLVLIGRRY
ncbi:MAG TPA: PEP-CTERM sorting domain-containing protein, partial [Bryobacteraceae bacterium]|nr:PEP-CTERM sorting domain-containing protein [Bryobacteraceae bacterium]